MSLRKVTVIFPGIGYTCDKPLLYYSGKLAAACGYEVVTVPYGNFPPGVKGNKEKMEACFFSALGQAEEMLREVDFSNCDILFISKSIGTVVAAAYAKKYQLQVRSVSFTPVEETFLYAKGDGIMFHGTADPWAADNEKIRENCRKIGQALYEVEQANHSLETGNVELDISNLKIIMGQVQRWLRRDLESSVIRRR